MVGGGPGAFIGGVHRMAAALDGEWELVAGAFSSDAAKSREQGRALGLDPKRVYASFLEMADAEGTGGAGASIDAVAIVTPNHLHDPVARAFLKRGIHVVCDKPMTTSLERARELAQAVERARVLFVLTHNYTGYPMVKEAREMVRSGRLGVVRKVVAQYSQGWLATRLEATGHKQAAWRQDPRRAGASSAVADIGTHLENLVGYVTGLEIDQVFADLSTLVPGRALDDDAAILVRFAGGARGVYQVTQVATGEENGLRLHVYGTAGGLGWCQERPDELHLLRSDAPEERLTRGSPWLSAASRRATRLPPGHPEGFIEAFANLYRSAGRLIGARKVGDEPDPLDLDVPDHRDGVRGMRFVDCVLRASDQERWVQVGGR